jgi:sortase A
LTRYVPEGASVPQLRRYGVGRISWTALPDRPGVVGIAGHRTTYGAPFFRLAKLERGDHIVITYAGKQFDYTVTERRVIRPAEVEVLQAIPGEHTVALVTCAPLYSAKNRLVVLGKLRAVWSLPPTP